MTPPILLIIDISNLLSRAWHSIKDPNPTDLAVHRAKKMVSTLLREVEPARLIGALDCGPSFRHELFPDYKGHRGEKTEELRAYLQDTPTLLVKEFGIELYQSKNFEADDVIATIADQCLGYGFRTLIVSNDQDLYQLVYDGPDKTGVYVLRQDNGSVSCITPEEVLKRKGVAPLRIPLLKAIQGDPSDNIAGVPKLGSVAAARLSGDYANVRKIFANLERLQSSDRLRLEAAGLEYVLLQENLTTLRRDAPLERV